MPEATTAAVSTVLVAGCGGGSHTPQAPHGPAKTSWKNLRLLRRANGYAYTTQKEARVSSPV
ncbi:hypothetical protein [Nocardiopsis quinghaiensis]|uniref:hypothetical protein n=1 Tax=Nocardiopsis quinghaiensis TaxID=464995 RepID=UPI00123C4368|nr:hypothetical protein [Nocardiopsis quinghaiensis]